MKPKAIIDTIEECFDMFEHIGMVKTITDDKTIYTYNPDYGKGYAKITKDLSKYYFSEINYTTTSGYKSWQCIPEHYATIGMFEQGKGISTQWEGVLKTPPMAMGISFTVTLNARRDDCIYCPPQTHCKGYGIILREAFLKEQLFDTILKKFGQDAAFFDIIKKAGNTCFPTFSQVIMYLKNCNYKKKAYQVALDAKIMEIIAVLIDAIENMKESDAHYLRDYERNAIHDATNILENNITLPPTVKSLSRQVGLNVNKLQLGFRLLYGTTVMEYLRNFRMIQSLELLARDISLSEVAKSVGYKSTSRFSEAFCDKYTLTPSQYRKLL